MIAMVMALTIAVLAASVVILIIAYARSRERIDLLYRLRLYTDDVVVKDERSIVPRLMDFVRRTATPLGQFKPIEKYDARMKQAGLPLLGSEFATILLLSSVAVGIFTFFLTLETSYAMIATIAVLVIEDVFVGWRIYRRRNAFTNQLGDCLTTVADSLRAGFSFAQSMEVIVRDMEPPISDEFARVMRDMSAGVSLERALEDMDKRVNSMDFSLVVTAVLIQRQVGGNLATILDNISETVIDRIKMKREVKTLTAQGRSTAKLLSAAPFVILVGMYFFARDNVMFFVENDIGRIAAVLAFISEAIGLYIIHKVTNLEDA
ncbi:MAG: type II secretion system F family protein [Selenomonadaceae bacterium]|nr:type II secretion system F family protein [Selenomonadaceae bacterium]